MRIGFDAKRLFCNPAGLGNYSRTLVTNLLNLEGEREYFLYSPKDKNIADNSGLSDHRSINIHIANKLNSAYWRSFSIIKQLKKDRIDIFHGLSNELPFSIGKLAIKKVVTIHDLIFRILPHTYSMFDRNMNDSKFLFSCKNADRILAISESTKADIIRIYDIPEDKIEVIYQACNPVFYDEMNHNTVELKSNIPSEYLLYVGAIEARKNIELIIRAYRYLPEELKIPLVMVGRGTKYYEGLSKLIRKEGIMDKIIWINDLTCKFQLRELYRRANALVYPSFYEGFGLPVAEGLLSGIPVITSNTSSLPEAAGPDSICIDPTQPEMLAEAIKTVLENTELRNRMIAEGRKYALQKFDPVNVTKQVVESYLKVMEQ